MLLEKSYNQIRFCYVMQLISYIYVCANLTIQLYKLCTKEYLAEGKDGYEMLKVQKRLVCMYACSHRLYILRTWLLTYVSYTVINILSLI